MGRSHVGRAGRCGWAGWVCSDGARLTGLEENAKGLGGGVGGLGRVLCNGPSRHHLPPMQPGGPGPQVLPAGDQSSHIGQEGGARPQLPAGGRQGRPCCLLESHRSYSPTPHLGLSHHPLKSHALLGRGGGGGDYMGPRAPRVSLPRASLIKEKHAHTGDPRDDEECKHLNWAEYG